MQPFNEPTALKAFNVSGTDIRFGQTEDSTPYSVAADFSAAMGYRQTKNALDLLDEDEKGFAQTETLGGRQRLAVIYEDGMWELIFRSTLPGAKVIKKQVKAILKQIRETGRFDAGAPPLGIGAGTVPWEHAAAVARSQGLRVDAHDFKELLISGGVLTTRNGAPHKKWEHLFWPVPQCRRWEIRSFVLPHLIYFAAQLQRELALAERNLQMSLPFPVGSIVYGNFNGGAL
jgi:prophage antirepressor-like protein